MSRDFKLPDLGEGIVEVELRAWLVREGEEIVEHQPVAEVETAKAIVQVPSPYGGRVTRIVRAVGETVRVGETLLVVGEGDWRPVARPISVGIVGELPEGEEPRPVLAMPAVRKLAREMGIELSAVAGTGPRGSITREDLEKRAATVRLPEAAAGAGGGGERIPLRGLRKTIAGNLMASLKGSAQVTVTEEADVSELRALREREQVASEKQGIHLTLLPFFIKATQHALQKHPSLNAAVDDAAGEIILKKEYHFGIAVDTADGLLVPVIRNVEEKSILQLARELAELGRRAAERSLSVDELRGGSFTITNYGHLGGLFSTPIINRPDVAILGFGRVAERPWAHRGEIAIRRILPISLTFDHRVTDGADASRFLTLLVSYLEDPGLLFIDSR